MGEITEGDGKDPLTCAIIVAAMAVHRALGGGFLEAVYAEAMTIELEALGIPFQREVSVPVFYRGRKLQTSYRADLVCYGKIIVELKAIKMLTVIEEAQVINYLKATGLPVALLLNFAPRSLKYKRFVLS